MIHAAYIHIPFCEHICHYCDFNKVFLKGQPVEEYLFFLEKEMELTLSNNPAKYLSSIFVGGGTPTALNEIQLEKLCNIIRTKLPYDNNTEFTFEANPGDLSKEKLQILYHFGVNRLSFGVQSFNDELLKKIGRTHRAKDVFLSIENAKKSGFNNINIDLIYSLPEQTITEFQETLQTAFTLDLKHYSAYSLIIEPKTVFYNLLRKGNLLIPEEDEEARMYELLLEKMESFGYQQYEVSNFCKPGFESYHNLTYWNNEQYYGFGAGAHCYINGIRSSNYGPLKKYMQRLKEGNLPIMEQHQVSKTEQMEEEMFLGLRKVEGVSISRFQNKFGENPLNLFKVQIDDMVKKDLLIVSNNQIKLTRKGFFLGNEVFQSFIDK